ncbi:MAG: quinol:electron acceptor oxidoreductase subunit ActD, partial [Planctomycetota bacterium]
MSETTANNPPAEGKMLGLLAEFAGPDELVEAADKTTDAGYSRVEAFSPFPIHGIDEALKAKKTILPWLVFVCGATGCIVALAMQYYMNATEAWWPFSGYQYRISGKPYFSLPANIPVTFELIILFSSFGSFFGMWALNKLPMLSNPLFKNPRFSTATSHGFFLWIDAKDKKFDEGDASSYLQSIGASAVDPIHEEVAGRDVPGILLSIGAVATAFALVPPLWVAAAAGQSSLPRLSIWWCMDYQPKYKAQSATSNSLFADGRSMRKAIPGTVARGALTDDLRYFRGLESEDQTIAASSRANVQFVNLLQNEGGEGEGGGDGSGEGDGGEESATPPEPDWTADFPEQVKITAEMMDRGEQRFNIYCATCHGLDGLGKGLITLRAQALEQGSWVQPTSLHTDDVRNQPVGKLFHSISNGVRRMPGYGQQISVEDRWAIIMYIRALQRQRAATLD